MKSKILVVRSLSFIGPVKERAFSFGVGLSSNAAWGKTEDRKYSAKKICGIGNFFVLLSFIMVKVPR